MSSDPQIAAEPEARVRFDVLGVPVDALDLPTAVRRIVGWAGDRVGRYVCVRDVHGVMRARDDATLMAIHHDADMVTPDGMPLVRIGRRRGYRVSQTCGGDLMETLLDEGRAHGLTHYLYGGNDGVADELAAKLVARFPGLEIVGTHCPPFRALSDEEMRRDAAAIEASGADVVWVGLSTPKQELWMSAMRPLSSATSIGVGAAFDFHAGHVPRAPVWVRKLTLEWAYRVAREPRRLGRRYGVMVPRFLAALAAERLRGKPPSATSAEALPPGDRRA